ncbi:MAG: pentapeptide repeat-containing protein [Planctomycetaceae bacterium]
MVTDVAAVRPRVVSPVTGETILLEEALRDWIERREPRIVQVIGPYGAGKSTALRHAEATLPSASGIRFLDDPDSVEVSASALQAMVVCGSMVPLAKHLAIGGVTWLQLAPWGEDEFIEYLLSAHHDQCASVIGRIVAAPDRQLLQGNPELSRLVLDRMAADESLCSIRDALLQEVYSHLTSPAFANRFQEFAVDFWCEWPKAAQTDAQDFLDWCPQPLSRLLRHRPVQDSLVAIAAKRMVAMLAANERCEFLQKQLPHELIREIGAQLDEPSRAALIDVSESRKSLQNQSTAASILVAADPNWRPTRKRFPHLVAAYLAGARWRGIDLSERRLERVDFSRADLRDAKLDGATAKSAQFRAALLDSASMTKIAAERADFTRARLTHVHAEDARFRRANFEGADLSDGLFNSAVFFKANLVGARFCRADLTMANLKGAEIEDADFTGSNLTAAFLGRLKLSTAHFSGARFAYALLSECDLELMHLPAADFEGANLSKALLTGSVIPGGNFQKADLRAAALAEIEWEGADLRNADLRECTFHMGSSRSGLLFTPIASEGTRTGFYTDDLNEQHFKAPEEIRKANLCGADLRGALIDKTDFYLVDLRGATYEPAQRLHFERCGAILDDRG